VIRVFELSPLLVQHSGGGVRAFGHCSSPLADLDQPQPSTAHSQGFTIACKFKLLQRFSSVINAAQREKIVKIMGMTHTTRGLEERGNGRYAANLST
jgi:hypothetical protein